MPRRDLSYLTDIIQAGKQIQEFIDGISKPQFDNSSLLQSAVIRQIEIIGEATKRLTEGFRAEHTEIPWKQMAGMRDILIHAYDHVDIDEVWNAIKTALPPIMEQIENLVPPV